MYKYQRDAIEKENSSYFNSVPLNQIKPLKDKRFVSLMGSKSHTYGNAISFMENYLINLFPKDLFKTIHVNSKIAHKQVKGTSHEFLKKEKPMIIFRPRVGDNDEEKFLKGTPIIERQTDIYSTWGATNLEPFYNDPINDICVKYQMNRTVMYMDVILVFSTLMNQLDYVSYLENAVRINHPFNLKTCFESYLPQEMLSIISQQVGIPLYDESHSTHDFLKYMNQNSNFPITYKLQTSSGTDEFYRYYPVTIDTLISNIDKDEGDKVGHVMGQYQMSFTIRMEFYSTGFYYIFSDKIYDLKLPITNVSEDSKFVPVFTDVLTAEDLNLTPGWRLYRAASARLESGEDYIGYNDLLNESIRAAIKYHLDKGIPVVEFLDIKVRKQGVLIHEGIDYDMNYEDKTIKFHDQSTFYTYRILVCVNIEYINDLMKQVYNLK